MPVGGDAQDANARRGTVRFAGKPNRFGGNTLENPLWAIRTPICFYDVVFSTRERQPWPDPVISTRLYEYPGGALHSEGGTSMSINGCADHIHVLAKLRQDKAVSDVLRAIKANSSGGALTVSQSQVEKVWIESRHPLRWFVIADATVPRIRGLTRGFMPSPASRVYDRGRGFSFTPGSGPGINRP